MKTECIDRRLVLGQTDVASISPSHTVKLPYVRYVNPLSKVMYSASEKRSQEMRRKTSTCFVYAPKDVKESGENTDTEAPGA